VNKNNTNAKPKHRKKKHSLLLGKTDKAKITQKTRRKVGNQAAYERLVEDELCMELTAKFAHESAKKTGCDDIGSIRDHYDTIVQEFVCARKTASGEKRPSLSTALRSKYETDKALTGFLQKLSTWASEYVLLRIRGEPDRNWTLEGHGASADFMNALAEEYVRDRNGLMEFLSAIFKHWRKIFEQRSLWQVRLLTQQLAVKYRYDRKRILDRLQQIGEVRNNLTANQTYAWLSRIGQYLSRDQRTAAGKDFGFRRRPKPNSFGGLLKPKSKKKLQ
jgi:hypothetical protein